MVNLAVSLGKLNLKNPVILASGTCGYGREISPYLDLNKVGAQWVKGLLLPFFRESSSSITRSIRWSPQFHWFRK